MTTPRYGMLFHFTHRDNLATILDAGELWSDTLVVAQGTLSNEAGDPEIKERRRRCVVDCGPAGVVADYVPFYFAARSPMMYKLWQGSVPSFTGDHRDLVYLVSDVRSAVQTQLPFVVSNRNAAVAVADFTDDLTLLGDFDDDPPNSDFIDWPLMKARMWSRTAGDPYRMERRMAEFLVHERFPLDALAGVGVQSEDRQAMIEHMFRAAGYDHNVIVRADWYYP